MRFLLITFLTLMNLESSLAASKAKNKMEQAEDNFSINNLETIMLDETELNKINKALKFFSEGKEYVTDITPNKEEEKVEKTLTDAEKENLKLSKELKLIEEKSRVYLGSILYFKNKVWSIWINNKRITSLSNNKDQEIFIKKINGNKVDIVWTISASKWKILMGDQALLSTPKTNELNQIKIKFTIHPNQTYLLRTNEVVEGKRFNRKTYTPQSTTQNQKNNELTGNN